MLAENLQSDRFWPQNNVFAIITAKPDYTYLDNNRFQIFTNFIGEVSKLNNPTLYNKRLKQNQPFIDR